MVGHYPLREKFAAKAAGLLLHDLLRVQGGGFALARIVLNDFFQVVQVI